MKKLLLLSSVLVALSSQNVFAADTYVVPATKPAFKFLIFNQGEQITDEEGTSVTSSYTLDENQRDALFDAAAN